MNKIVLDLRRQLKKGQNKKGQKIAQTFFKEKISCYGISTPQVRQLAKSYQKDIEQLSKKEVFQIADEFFKASHNEEATIAIQFLGYKKAEFIKNDFKIFKNWLSKNINNWGKTDDFCLHLIWPMIDRYPDLMPELKSWAVSKNPWLRRASAVGFITTDKNGFYATSHNLQHVFAVAKSLMADKEDLVQKGYGWMLKAASVHHQAEVFKFVMKNKKHMTRTALRYAIEHFPEKLRRSAMAK